MEKPVLTTQNLTKKFGSFTALDNVTLTLEKGHIYGFIGENGAGKTTFLRIIAGLSYPTAGDYQIFGKRKQKEKEQVRKFVGCTIEDPVLYPNLSALQNMELQRKLLGNPDSHICIETLEQVGLSDTAGKKVKNFSVGMKKRLSLGLALLNKPQFLLLDEPVNGLDPSGIANIRSLLKTLQQEQGITILISSHILTELYLLATDYIIIKNGKILNVISQEALENQCRKFVCIHMEKSGLLALEKGLGTTDYKVMEDGSVRLFSHISEIENIAKLLYDNGVLVTHLSVSEQTLEEYYFEVTGGGRHV